MLEKLLEMVRRYDLIAAGDTVTCAVSGGADSVALLFALYLLREKLGIQLRAAHFNHHLRDGESDRDEAFVRQLCSRYDIALSVGHGSVTPGKKGLEAAAREARYAFFATLGGKIATAHTADDNAETVLMHMVRGTGLKGLGAIAPVRGNLIRPMLLVTRHQVMEFLREYHLEYVSDSSNDTDLFLRNRLRHHVMPLLKQENPRIAENLSAMALRLRCDEQALRAEMDFSEGLNISEIRSMPQARLSRVMAEFLESCDVREPEAEHIALLQKLIVSENPSAKASFPGGVTICRQYDRLVKAAQDRPIAPVQLCCPGCTKLPELGLQVICSPAETLENGPSVFSVCPEGSLVLRCRQEGDALRLPGGTKTLKKLFIDRKIPAQKRLQIPVVCDAAGVLGVYGIGVNQDRMARQLPCVQIRLERICDDIESEDTIWKEIF